VTVPLATPLAAEVIVIHDASVEAVQVHPANVEIVIGGPGPPPAGNDSLEGEIA
jgi:hypothetical protein